MIVWEQAKTVLRDGSLILVLLSDFDVYACRWDGEMWAEPTWDGCCFDETTTQIIGWLPFPLINDPFLKPSKQS